MIKLETSGILISVEVDYLPSQSDSMRFNYVFMYTITIENKTKHAVQLLGRRWEITDSNGEKNFVNGRGVIGEVPVILPNERYTYSSGCHLCTDFGKMKGEYMMRKVEIENSIFTVQIPEFQLIIPCKLN